MTVHARTFNKYDFVRTVRQNVVMFVNLREDSVLIGERVGRLICRNQYKRQTCGLDYQMHLTNFTLCSKSRDSSDARG